MDDLTFLETGTGGGAGGGAAILRVILPGGQVCHVSDSICPYQLLDKCPLLYHAFEHSSQNFPQASIQASSPSAIIALLRFCYTDSYLPPNEATVSLLLHAEVHKLAEDLDAPELKSLALANFMMACRFPEPPQALLETIRFIYSSQRYRQQQGLLDTLLNFCIRVFQHLAESPEFLALAKEFPEFCQDLCRTNMLRNFEDDCEFCPNLSFFAT
jgi:hypothetical protein